MIRTAPSHESNHHRKKKWGCSSLKLKTSCCKVKISSREYCKVLGMTKKSGERRERNGQNIYTFIDIYRDTCLACVLRKELEGPRAK